MNNRIFFLLFALLSALTSFADKKMTIRNTDTGESFEVSVRQLGFLSKDNMTMILTYCEKHGKDDKIPFSDEDLARFDKLCSKEYRDHINAPAVVEEVVEMDECPVELIGE